MSERHDVRVEAERFNDGTAGLSLWCETCQRDVDGWDDGSVTLHDLTVSVTRHLTSEPTP